MLIFLVHVHTTKTVLTVPRLLGTDFDSPPVLLHICTKYRHCLLLIIKQAVKMFNIAYSCLVGCHILTVKKTRPANMYIYYFVWPMSLVASRRCSILLWIEFAPSSLMCYYYYYYYYYYVSTRHL